MFLFFGPVFTIVLIYVVAAVLPAVVLIRYANRQPSLHHQPTSVMVHLVWCGVLAALCALVVEWLADYFVFDQMTETWINYLCVGLIEEGAKLYFLKKETWDSPYFQTRYDAILYSVFVSLGFAAFENIRYVFGYGLDVALGRAVLAVPAHMAFAVLMGFFYGRAKRASYFDHKASESVYAVLTYAAPVALHCVYDSFASYTGQWSTIAFIIVVALIYLIIFKLMRREAVADKFV